LALSAPAALGSLGAGAASGAASGRIVFSKLGGKCPEIFVMNADGSNQKALACGHQPAISRNGSKIVFIRSGSSGGQVWTMDANGANQTRVTNNTHADYEPAISPQAKKIAFVSNRQGLPEIFEMNADGTDVRRLTHGSDAPASQPSFSSDGKKIVFTRNRGSVPGEKEVFQHEIYVMNADGTNDIKLTRSGNDERPTFSPDDRTILYASRQFVWRIHTINAQTGGDLTTPHPNSFDNENEPAFSPDGSKIVFVRPGGAITARLFSMNRDGSDVVQLTHPNLGIFDVLPTWVSETVG
jgi:Tol biopolymer transport system component